MSRLTIGLLLATSLIGVEARAETQAEIAARENEQGKTLMFGTPPQYAEASAKFQDAVARVPEPKYFFNLCTSRFAEGKFGEALTACNAADKNADEKLKTKTAKLVEKIREEAQKQGIDLQATGGGGGPGETPPIDPNNPNAQPPPTGDPNNPNAQPMAQNQAVGRPPPAALFTSAPPQNTYTWSLGIDLYTGGGRIGREGYFGTSAGGVRIKGDYMLNPAQRIGAQGYFQLTHFGEGNENTLMPTGYTTLDVFDLGIAGYKHLCGASARGCITPLIGVQLALMSPAGEGNGAGEQVFNYASGGARLELALTYALGRRFEHVLGLTFGLNAYTAAFSEPTDGGFTAMEWGLDKGGAAGSVGLGYTYRFNTPFGHAPFVTLE